MKILSLCVFVIGLSSGLTAGSQVAPGDSGIGFEEAVTTLADTLGTAERIEIYEGLPSPFGERELFENQKRSKDCRQIAGEWFYAKPKQAELGDSLALQRLLAAHLFQPWGGMKLCGVFHADFAVALTTGKKTLNVFFCFGCHEARILSEIQPFAGDLHANDFRLTTDLKENLFVEWRTRLLAYRKERPVHAIVPSGG
jgi:hypothetical protein